MIKEEPTLYVAGISHRTSDINVREKFQLDRKEIKNALAYLRSVAGVEGIVIITTCNRVEFYMVYQGDDHPFGILTQYYKMKDNTDIIVDKPWFYLYEKTAAAKHLFKVITGLDSMVLGEYQIQGQIKDAYSIACSQKTADKILHKLFHAAFRTGKTIRNTTHIGECSKSISGVACKIIKEKISSNDTISIIGVNHNTRIVAKTLFEAGYSNLIFVNRTLFKAEEMAEKFQGKALNLKSLEEAILTSRCIVTCTGAPGCIISSELLNSVHAKRNASQLIIDMAVPRDVENIGLSPDIELYDLERLSVHIENEKKEVLLAIPEAERIIEAESRIFEAWNEAQSDTTFVFLDDQLETVRQQILSEYRSQFSEKEISLLEKFSHALIHRLKSTITRAVKINLGNTEIHKAG